jgi:ATP-binding cassette subfamily C protein CydC
VAHPGSRTPVLSDLSLTVMPGERVALIGASGAGKSTLLAAIAGEITPQSGHASAQPACLLTQRTELFQDSVRDNLLPRRSRSASDDATLGSACRTPRASTAGSARHASRSGSPRRLGEGGLGLSGGQSRRLALARLLLRPVPASGCWTSRPKPWTAPPPHDVLAAPGTATPAARTVLLATHLRREAELADRLLLHAIRPHRRRHPAR